MTPWSQDQDKPSSHVKYSLQRPQREVRQSINQSTYVPGSRCRDCKWVFAEVRGEIYKQTRERRVAIVRSTQTTETIRFRTWLSSRRLNLRSLRRRILKPRLHDTTCCQKGCRNGSTTGCIVYRYSNIQPVIKTVWQPVWQTAVSCIQPVAKPVVQPGLTTGWTNSCSFNTVVKPAVKPVWKPHWQPVGCLFTRYSRLSNQLYNRFNNRLCRVNGV